MMNSLKRVALLSVLTMAFSGLLSGIQAAKVDPDAMMAGAMALVFAMKEERCEIQLPMDSAFDGEALHHYARMLYPEYYSLSWTVQGGVATVKGVFSQPEQVVQARALAAALVEETVQPELDTPQKLRLLHDLLARRCVYDYDTAANPDTAGDMPFTAYGALVEGKAVCDGYTAAFALLCETAGIPCIAVYSREMNHSWNAVLCDGEVLYVDVTYNDTTATCHRQTPPYFMLTPQELTQSHIWDWEEGERLLEALTSKNN